MTNRELRTPCFLLVPFLLVCLLWIHGCDKRRPADDYRKAIGQSTRYLEELRERFKIPGIAVAVAINDSIVWSRGFGYANIDARDPVTPTTMFRIGSVSKVLTAGAVALLHERGKLDLDVPVQHYVPEFPKKRYPVTTRQLAGHLAGIRDYTLDEREDKRHYEDVIAALELFSADSLEYPPGERYSYSSYGWNLIAAVIQRASGKPFLQFMQESILYPLRMHHTAPDDTTQKIPKRASFYSGPTELALPIDVSYKWASGGFLSTAEDLVRFGSAFLPGSDFLKTETRELLVTNQRTNDGKETIHGIGWVVQKFENGKPLYYHPGSMTGCQAILVVQPEDRIVVAMLANRAAGFGELTANQIACFFLGMDEDDCPEIEGERKRRMEKHERYQMLSAAIREWKLALEQSDLKKLMAAFSENFRSRQWDDKRAMMREFQRSFATGKTSVDDENLHLRFQSRGYPPGTLTYVEGLKTTGSFGPFSLRLTFIREESGPLIVDLELMQAEN